MAEKSNGQPLPERIVGLLQEARWLALVALAVYIGLILAGYDKADPGWSQAVVVSHVANPGGRFGAWLADLLLYLFGLSAWWSVLFLLAAVAWGYRRLSGLLPGDRRPFLIALAGFLILLAASCGIETLRFYSLKTPLPFQPGGMLGFEVGRLAADYLGYSGSTLILLALFAAGLSLFTGISWLRLAEICGGLIEAAGLGAVRLWQTWQDRRIGRVVAGQREAVIEVERKKFEEQPFVPVKIEPVAADIPRAPKAEARIEKERQAPLFFDAPGGALPPLHLLDEAMHKLDELPGAETLEFTSRLIERKLADFGVEVKVISAHPGPVVTRYEIDPAVGVKGSQIVNLAKDLARALALVSIRVVETVPGKPCMALELPNAKRQTVRLSEIIGSKAYHDLHAPLAIALGKDISGLPVVVDLARMPHLLVAGTTGSGKSVGINAMILSLVYKSEPKDVRLIMVDPKMLELSVYEGIPHLLAPVVTDMTKAANALHWCVGEMERRYQLMAALGVRNIAGFNRRVKEATDAGKPILDPVLLARAANDPTLDQSQIPHLSALPYVVVVIDELADLMMIVGKKVEELIARLAQKARASGIHLVLATQRPSVDVITGLIKANIPCRIAFQVSAKVDSRTILDQMGAETLLGHGDMLYLPSGTALPKRVHGAFVSDQEVHRVAEALKKIAPPNYVEEVLDGPQQPIPGLPGEEGEGGAVADPEQDALYDEAVRIVTTERKPSISYVQRRLKIGYNRAARLLEAMEMAGLVGPLQSNGAREVLVPARPED